MGVRRVQVQRFALPANTHFNYKTALAPLVQLNFPTATIATLHLACNVSPIILCRATLVRLVVSPLQVNVRHAWVLYIFVLLDHQMHLHWSLQLPWPMFKQEFTEASPTAHHASLSITITLQFQVFLQFNNVANAQIPLTTVSLVQAPPSAWWGVPFHPQWQWLCNANPAALNISCKATPNVPNAPLQ